MFTVSKLYPPFRRNEELTDLEYEAYENANLNTDVVDSSVAIRWICEGEESEERFNPKEMQPSCYVLGTSPRVAPLLRQFCNSDSEKGDDDPREGVHDVHRAIMEIHAKDGSILSTIGQIYLHTFTRAVIVVCDSVIPDELAFKWAEVVFGAFADASGEIKEKRHIPTHQHVPIVIFDSWVGEKAKSAFICQGAQPGKDVDVQVIVSSSTSADRMKLQALDKFPRLHTPVLLSGASAAVLSRSKGRAVSSGCSTAAAYSCCVCFLSLMTWAADYTIGEILKDAIKCAAFELLPKGVMNYSQDKVTTRKGPRGCLLTVAEEFNCQTEGLYL